MSVGICQSGGSLEPCVTQHTLSATDAAGDVEDGEGSWWMDGERSRGAKLWAMRCRAEALLAQTVIFEIRLMSKEGGLELVSC